MALREVACSVHVLSSSSFPVSGLPGSCHEAFSFVSQKALPRPGDGAMPRLGERKKEVFIALKMPSSLYY